MPPGARPNFLSRATHRASDKEKIATLEADRDNALKRIGILEALPPDRACCPTIIRAVLYTTVSVGDGNEFEIVFDEWENEDITIFGEELSGGKLQKIQLLAQGSYGFAFNIEWQNNFNANHGPLLLDDSAATSSAGFSPINMGAYNNGFDADSFVYPPMLGFVRKYPRYGVTPIDVIGGMYGRMLPKVIQYSGIAQNLEAAALEITYLGPTINSI